tara:strand:- start:1857 stop:1997 length:141 start_codon:yes stop_codon:yes gene_type:complete
MKSPIILNPIEQDIKNRQQILDAEKAAYKTLATKHNVVNHHSECSC